MLAIVDLKNASERLKVEITRLEDDLAHTGTVKTADDVQEELGNLGSEM